jgi:hypothetical protein
MQVFLLLASDPVTCSFLQICGSFAGGAEASPGASAETADANNKAIPADMNTRHLPLGRVQHLPIRARWFHG